MIIKDMSIPILEPKKGIRLLFVSATVFNTFQPQKTKNKIGCKNEFFTNNRLQPIFSEFSVAKKLNSKPKNGNRF